MKRVIIWGAGENTQRVIRRYYYPLKMIEAVIDRDEKKQNNLFLGNKVISPDKVYELQSDVILIGTYLYFEDAKRQIESMKTGKSILPLEEYLDEYYARAEEETSLFRYNNERMELLDNRLKEAGGIPQELIAGAELLASRFEAIKRMPKGMMTAEVGVAYGDFSDFILKNMEPEHFYAIDFFNKGNPFISFWGRTDFEDSGLPHEEWYRKRFKNEIDEGKMSVCSGFSWDILEEFEDNYFDYIYLDACHDYESVVKDIEVSYRKVKHGGYIQFNDYTLYDMYLRNFYGVVPAVNDFIRKTKSRVVYYCLDLLRFDDIVVKINKNQ